MKGNSAYRVESPTSANSAGLVECAGLAGSVPESNGLCSVADNLGQIASACPAGRLCRLAVLSYPRLGSAGLRDYGVALEDELGVETGRVGPDGAGDAIPVRSLVRHYCCRDFRGDCPRAVAEGLRHPQTPANMRDSFLTPTSPNSFLLTPARCPSISLSHNFSRHVRSRFFHDCRLANCSSSTRSNANIDREDEQDKLNLTEACLRRLKEDVNKQSIPTPFAEQCP